MIIHYDAWYKYWVEYKEKQLALWERVGEILSKSWQYDEGRIRPCQRKEEGHACQREQYIQSSTHLHKIEFFRKRYKMGSRTGWW